MAVYGAHQSTFSSLQELYIFSLVFVLENILHEW